MFIVIWGFKEFKKRFGIKYEWCMACKNCSITYIRSMLWFTLFFIPLFPVSFKYSKVCNNCGYPIKLSKKQFKLEIKEPDSFKPSPFKENSYPNSSLVKRTITVKRKKSFSGSTMQFFILVDGHQGNTLKNGETTIFDIDNKQRNLFLIASPISKINNLQSDIYSNIIFLPADSNNYTIHAEFKKQKLLLTQTSPNAITATNPIATN